MTMSLNRRALWVVEALLAHAEERRVAVHSIEGGGRYIDCGIEPRAAFWRASSWLESVWGIWLRCRLFPAKSAAGQSR